MSCWCDDIDMYFCGDCEDKLIINKLTGIQRVRLKRYAKILNEDTVDFENKTNQELMIYCLQNDLYPSLVELL